MAEDYEPLDIAVLEELLDRADQVGLFEFNMRVEVQERPIEQGGDIYFIIGNLSFEDEETGEIIQTEDERIMTVYTSLTSDDEPTYDASAVAKHIITATSVLPGLVVQLIDAIDHAEELIKSRSAATYLAGQVYRQMKERYGESTELERIWRPLLKVLDVSDLGFDDFLSSMKSFGVNSQDSTSDIAVDNEEEPEEELPEETPEGVEAEFVDKEAESDDE